MKIKNQRADIKTIFNILRQVRIDEARTEEHSARLEELQGEGEAEEGEVEDMMRSPTRDSSLTPLFHMKRGTSNV